MSWTMEQELVALRNIARDFIRDTAYGDTHDEGLEHDLTAMIEKEIHENELENLREQIEVLKNIGKLREETIKKLNDQIMSLSGGEI